MEQKGFPLLLAVLAFFAVSQAPRLVEKATEPEAVKESATPAAAPRTEPAGAPGDQAGTATGPATNPAWKEPLRLYREFFGIPDSSLPGEEDDASTLKAVLEQAHDGSYRLESLVALVPDPVDSSLAANFDQAVEAIQAAFAANGYLLDRFSLPWTDDDAKEHRYRTNPGLLLFRRNMASPTGEEDRRLMAVFLVGETPKQGIHKAAFRAALGLAGRLSPPATPQPAPDRAAQPAPPSASPAPAAPQSTPRLGILGPSFSGSALSLRLALLQWTEERSRCCAGQPRPSFQVMSGSATTPGLESFFGGLVFADVRFARTVQPDDQLQGWAFQFLQSRMGWEPSKMALLSEFDTLYGQAPIATRSGVAAPITVHFPSGLSSIRSAWESDEKQAGATAAEKSPVKLPRSSLELNLADKSKPVDIVPQFSTLSVAGNDLALSNLMDSLWRGGIRYLGILSTDARDKLFLAERIRRFAPDMVVFTLDNNLLYAHPQYSGDLDGTLVLTSFPLATESESWREVFGGPGGRYRRQFISEFEQGIYLATEALMDPAVHAGRWTPPRPRGWIAAVGNGSLWPIASSAALPSSVGYQELAGRGDLQLLLLVAILCLLAGWLDAVYPPAKMLAGTGKPDLTARRLLVFGSLVLIGLGGVLVVLGTLPLWAPWLSAPPSLDSSLLPSAWQDRVFQILYLTALAAGYLFLLWSGARASSPSRMGETPATGRRPWTRRRNGLAWALAGLLLLPGFAVLLNRLWMPGGSEFFYLRARKLTSGLSPVVSLGLLGFALYGWVLLELKRRRLIARQAIEWPLQWRLEPPLEGSHVIAQPLFELLHRTFPSPRSTAGEDRAIHGAPAAAGSWFWIALLLVVVPPMVMLLRVVQPICESRWYGWILLVLFLLAFVLAAVSFHQFLAIWFNLERLLQRLDRTRLGQAFQRVSAEVGWSPMRAFGWQLPNFKMLVLSSERLYRWAGRGLKDQLRERLDALFQADQAGDLSAETRARADLDRIYFDACRELAPRWGEPEVEEFFAIRIVAFLGPVISHMRNCLMAAMLASLFLLFAVRSYAFEPRWFVSMGIWAALAIGIAVTLWVFVQMDRNATLSAIGGTPSGKVSFDRHFFANVITYGAIPLAGILLTQFPAAGRFLAGWLNPLLRIVGTS